MRPRDLAALVVLGAVWGASFLFIRVAAPALGPFPLMGTRVTVAALALAPFLFVLGRYPEVRKRWKQFLFVGTLNAAMPFSLIAFAETEITASLAAILNSTTVLFSVLVGAWLGEALTARRIAGVILGIFGVAVLVGLDPMPLNGAVLVAVGAMLTGSLCYALGGNYVKKAFEGVRPLTMAFGQQAGAAVVLLPLAAATLPSAEAASVPVALSALGLALVSTAFAYLLFFALIARVGATSTLTVTFLSPGFGVLFGVLLLGEPFGVGTLLGLGIVLSAVALVTGVGSRKGS